MIEHQFIDIINLNKQFILDLPRLTLYLDNSLCNESSNYVRNYIKKYIKNKKEQNYCIYFLTQTSLADFFTNEAMKGQKFEHLVDDEGYVVKIDTQTKRIEVFKNFKKIYLEDDIVFHLDFARLSIFCDLEKKLMIHDWDYDFDENKTELVVIEKLE